MEIVSINKENLDKNPGAICFINPKNPAYSLKINWILQRLNEGLRIKLLYSDKGKKVVGFIEYLPGEHAWRAVSADKYMFIHCIWISPNKNKNKGFGSRLIDECINDARKENYNGVAVVTSNRAFMANSRLFLKNGFSKIANDEKGNELLALTFKNGKLPLIKDWKSQLVKYKGLHIVYTRQCP